MAFTSIQKIRFDDVDGAGIVYYPQFFHLCHAAFEDFFDTVAHVSYPDLVAKNRLGFPTVAITSEFHAPLVYGDTAIVSLDVRRIGTTSLTFAYAIRRKRDGELCFEAEVTTVMVEVDGLRPIPLPQEYRQLFERYLTPRRSED
jgi:4-hydroxybenzoyl-CoA thioesterase